MDKIPKLFFLDGELNEMLRRDTANGSIVTFNYPREQRMWYDFFYARREHQKAFLIEEVSELLEKPAMTIKNYIGRNLISRPSGRSYHIASKKPKKDYWSEDDVLALREEFYALAKKNKYGEPFSNFKLVSKAELLGKLRNEQAMYMKNDNGEFVKVWKAF